MQPTMNEDILKYPIYALSESGKLVRIKWLYCTAQYDIGSITLTTLCASQ